MIFKDKVKNPVGKTINTLTSNISGEYTANVMSLFCEQNGIAHEFTAPYIPESNEVDERNNNGT